MAHTKISIISVTRNASATFERCIRSVLSQTFNNIEYIVIDGGSDDGTLQLAEKYRENIVHLVSEPDKGIYDAMNKGIRLATGDIIGILNADDFFADELVLADVESAFRNSEVQLLYGDLDFIDMHDKVVRKWRSGNYKSGKFNWGWMPPHPTFYCRREVFSDQCAYSLDYGSAADYELMLRLMHNSAASHIIYLHRVMIKMQVGGVSNKSFKNRFSAMANDYKAMKNNNVPFPLFTIILKPLRKLGQFF